MKSNLPDRSIGSIPVNGPLPRQTRETDGSLSSGHDDARFFAAIAAGHTGRSVAEELSELENALKDAPRARLRDASPDFSPVPSKNKWQSQALSDVRARIEHKFQGKIETGSTLLARQTTRISSANLLPAPSAKAALDKVRARGPKTEQAHNLSRNQRRVLVKHASRQLNLIAKRYLAPDEERGGVWSREDYRRIRAAVQDASGRAACCILYQLGSREAVTLASELDPRVPMDRRKIAFAYAVARAPGSDLGERLKLGFAMGLWSSVLADPNNPNMERHRRFRPSRRTLCTDLTWLEEHRVLKRWQVKMEHAAPCERKQNPNYPTNRYFAPMHRDGGSMMRIALALGDVPPEVLPNPSEQWSQEDAEALAQTRELLLRELGVEPFIRPPD